MGKFVGRLEMGWEKWLKHKSGNIPEKRKDRGKDKLINALSNAIIPDPLRPPLAQDWSGRSQPPPKTSIAISPSQDRVKVQTSHLLVDSQGPSEQK